MMGMRPEATTARGGFTLVELIVASTLMMLVLAGVYTTFSTAIRTWRGGEVNYQTYEDARRAIGMLESELRAIPVDALHLVNGEDDRLEFVTLNRPMRSETASGERLLQVTYRVARDRDTGTQSVIREEALVEGPLTRPRSENDRGKPFSLDLGRSYAFTLASDVEELAFNYVWALPLVYRPNQPPAPAEFVDDEALQEALPEGIEVSLRLRDPGTATGNGTATFRTMVVLRFGASAIPSRLLPATGGIAR